MFDLNAQAILTIVVLREVAPFYAVLITACRSAVNHSVASDRLGIGVIPNYADKKKSISRFTMVKSNSRQNKGSSMLVSTKLQVVTINH